MLIPTRLVVVFTFNTFVSTVRSPVMVAEARVADGEQARMLLMLIRLVLPDAGGVSDTSTIGIMSLAGSAAVNAVSAVIFESAISVNG